MTDRLEELERLVKLRDLDILTPEEFAAEKARILGTGATQTLTNAADPASSRSRLRIGTWKFPPWAIGGVAATILGLALGYATIGNWGPEGLTGAEPNNRSERRSGQVLENEKPDLGTLLTFSEPENCVPSKKLQSFLDDLSARTLSDINVRVPGMRDPVKLVIQTSKEAGDANGATLVSAPISGLWNDLKVTTIQTITWKGSEAASFQIRFAEPFSFVRRVLNREGFKLGGDGELKEAAANPAVRAFGLETIQNSTALTCGTA